jgi:hypothetical protein
MMAYRRRVAFQAMMPTKPKPTYTLTLTNPEL